MNKYLRTLAIDLEFLDGSTFPIYKSLGTNTNIKTVFLYTDAADEFEFNKKLVDIGLLLQSFPALERIGLHQIPDEIVEAFLPSLTKQVSGYPSLKHVRVDGLDLACYDLTIEFLSNVLEHPTVESLEFIDCGIDVHLLRAFPKLLKQKRGVLRKLILLNLSFSPHSHLNGDSDDESSAQDDEDEATVQSLRSKLNFLIVMMNTLTKNTPILEEFVIKFKVAIPLLPELKNYYERFNNSLVTFLNTHSELVRVYIDIPFTEHFYIAINALRQYIKYQPSVAYILNIPKKPISRELTLDYRDFTTSMDDAKINVRLLLFLVMEAAKPRPTLITIQNFSQADSAIVEVLGSEKQKLVLDFGIPDDSILPLEHAVDRFAKIYEMTLMPNLTTLIFDQKNINLGNIGSKLRHQYYEWIKIIMMQRSGLKSIKWLNFDAPPEYSVRFLMVNTNLERLVISSIGNSFVLMDDFDKFMEQLSTFTTLKEFFHLNLSSQVYAKEVLQVVEQFRYKVPVEVKVVVK